MEKRSAADLVRNNYYEYGKFINMGGRVVCDESDGLKAVQRRILYAAYKIASNRQVKTATLVGETMGHYHPHGDAAIATAVAGLVRDGMLVGIGNFGSTAGLDIIEPAAMRYTECMLDPRILKVAFKYINDVEYFNNDLSYQEPLYIPTPLPLNICHFSNEEDFVTGIGFGIKYNLPKFEVEDLFKLLKLLIEKKQYTNDIRVRYRSISIPCPDELFNTGKGSLYMTARYTVNSNKKSFNVLEFPPLMVKTPESLLGPFDSIPQDFSKDSTNVFVELPRGKTTDDYEMEKLLTSKYNVDMYFHNNEIIKHYSLPEILMTTYGYYKKAVLNHIEKNINKLTEHIKLVELLIKMKPYLNPLDEKTPERIKKGLKLDDKTVNELIKYNIKQICTAEAHLEDSKKELKDWGNKKSNLDEFCIKEIENGLKEKT